MAKLIKDTLPMMQALSSAQETAARKHGLPVFKGKLFRHEGGLTENLDKYGRPIFNFVNENTVVIGGAVLALEKLFYGVPAAGEDPLTGANRTIGFMPKTLNEMYSVNAGVKFSDAEARIALFGCGVGGCGLEWGTAYDPDFKQDSLGTPNDTWIPFRVSTTDQIPSEGNTPANYFFRMPITIGTGGDTGYAWYLKEFANQDSRVPIKSLWQDTLDPSDDGSEIIGDTIDSDRNDLIECFGECVLTLTEDDLREFFYKCGNLTNARFNQIGLFTGTKKQITENYYDYVGVRLFSVVNFDNISVKEPTTNTFVYRIYAAV